MLEAHVFNMLMNNPLGTAKEGLRQIYLVLHRVDLNILLAL